MDGRMYKAAGMFLQNVMICNIHIIVLFGRNFRY